MTNNVKTKRALLSSVIALILCMAMLVGTTFAWFTDSVVSGKNHIVAGNLDVELEYLVDGKWEAVDAATNIFGDSLWEPGHTEVVTLKISNVGTLALKYQLGINVAEELTSINVAGEELKLSDHIEFGVVDGQYADRAAARAAVTNSAKISEGYTEDATSLLPGEAKEITLVVYMPESVGNEANHKTGEVAPEVWLGINLMATQLMHEEDSFDNTYDENAPFGTYVVLNAGDNLLDIMKSAEAGKPLTIKLNSDAEWPTEGHNGENDITPATAIVIDGNGHTITATGSGVTPWGDTEAPMTLKNVTIVDNSVSYAEGAWEFTYLELGGPSLTCNNVTFADEIQTGTNATFTNCSFESNEESVYAVWVENGSATFNNCSFTGYRGLKTHEAYGTEVNSVIVKNCTFSNLTKKPGIALGTLNADTTVSVTNSTFINCQAGDQGLYIYETDTDVSTINFTEANNTVYKNVKYVGTAAELIALGGTNVEGAIILTNDIDLNGAELKTIGVTYNKSLEILGNGHKISNAKIATGKHNGMTNMGMFYVETGATFTVSDLVINGMTVADGIDENTIGAALVAYANQGSVVTLDNVDINGASINNTKGNAAIYVGYTVATVNLNGCDIGSDCTVNGERADKTGAFVGTANTAACVVTVTNCTNGTSANDYGRVINGATYN